MKTSPTQRSMAYYRAAGCLVCKVEHWNPHAKVRVDAFGFIDLLVLGKGAFITAVQTTTGANLAARRMKILTDPKVAPAARLWLECGGAIQIHGWAKQGPRGKRKLWELRMECVLLEDFPALKESVLAAAHLGSC